MKEREREMKYLLSFRKNLDSKIYLIEKLNTDEKVIKL